MLPMNSRLPVNYRWAMLLLVAVYLWTMGPVLLLHDHGNLHAAARPEKTTLASCAATLPGIGSGLNNAGSHHGRCDLCQLISSGTAVLCLAPLAVALANADSETLLSIVLDPISILLKYSPSRAPPF